MPKLKKLNVKEAKHIIRKIFIEKIIEAKGIKKAEVKILKKIFIVKLVLVIES